MQGVIFDMDGVLFDTERLCMESWKRVAAAKQIDDIEASLIGCIGLNRNDTMQFMLQKYGADFAYEDFRKLASAFIQEMIKKEGLPVKPGAYELLAYLKERQVKTGLASSTRTAAIREHLLRAGMENCFEVIVGGDMLKHSKPEPDIYLLACSRLQTEPSQTYAIEDSPAGIYSAYRAGMKPILVPDLIEPKEKILDMAVMRKDSLAEVQDWFEQEHIFTK